MLSLYSVKVNKIQKEKSQFLQKKIQIVIILSFRPPLRTKADVNRYMFLKLLYFILKFIM